MPNGGGRSPEESPEKCNKEGPVLLWHHKVHEVKFRESLAYYQLQFAPDYHRDEVWHRLQQIVDTTRATSSCIYETFGMFDIMLRVWLPMEVTAPIDFTDVLSDGLRDLNCSRVLPFLVSRQVHHWAWWNPDSAQLDEPNEDQVRDLDVSRVLSVQAGEASQEDVGELVRLHLLRLAPGGDGVKFFVIVPPTPPGTAPVNAVAARLVQTVSDALIRAASISQPSVYVGTGFVWILVKGKFETFEAYRGISRLIDDLNETAVIDGLSVRTYTYLVTGDDEKAAREIEGYSAGRLYGGREIEESFDPYEYLEREEGERFEVKASLALDVAKVVFKGEAGTREERIALEGVLKTIVAFLNSRGGDILIGALERSRYGKFVEKEGSAIHGAPVVGDWIATGVEWEFKYCSQKNMDGFKLLLSDLVRSRIGADAAALLTVMDGEVEDRRLVLVRVREGFDWHYLDNSLFYVRRANSTEQLDGRERERYQRANPRQ